MKLLYVHSKDTYPQNKHLIDGFRELGHEVVELRVTGGGWRTIVEMKERIRSEGHGCDAVFVGYTSPLMIFAAKLAGTKKIIFNATASQYEANIISRGEVGHFFLSAVKWWIVDFLSFHISTKVLLESDAQIRFVRRMFFMSSTKLARAYSGLDESIFYFDPSVPKLSNFTAVFRGRFLPESGILTVLEATKKLEGMGVNVRVIGEGMLYREVNALIAKLQPNNLDFVNRRLTPDELRKNMLECHVSLGQLARHPRLKRTLPCKLFESLALGLPYLTGRNAGALEILEDGKNCLAVNPGDANDLTQKILQLRDNHELLTSIGRAGHELYRERLTSKILAQETFAVCFDPASPNASN